MAKRLKVYGGMVMNGARQSRAVIAAHNAQEVADALGNATAYYVRGYWSVTGNAKEVQAAMTMPGCAGPTGGRGGIAHSTWSNHKLERGESWPFPIASDPNFAFTMNVGRADASAYVEYWPSMLPGFLPIFWTERRFTTELDRDGRPTWRAIPLD